jgi:hypothetical protein
MPMKVFGRSLQTVHHKRDNSVQDARPAESSGAIDENEELDTRAKSIAVSYETIMLNASPLQGGNDASRSMCAKSW